MAAASVCPDLVMSFVTEAFEIDDSDSFATARELLRKEGILGGSSTGTLLAGALRYCRQQTKPKRVVTFVCDSGNKYLSKMFNDVWMAEQGFTIRPMRLRALRASRLELHKLKPNRPSRHCPTRS